MTKDPSSLKSLWSFPTQVRFGAGAIAGLPRACQSLGIQRPLLVTDPGLAALPMVQDVVARNGEAGVPTGLFSAVKGNPVGKNVEDGVAAYKEGGHDGVIAFGGGSALDAGKVIAFAAVQERPIWDFEDRGDDWKAANPDIPKIIAVPTTAGTGSEVGRAGVILDERDHTKKIIFHPNMLPAIVVSDPELTVGLPPHITAATGMDALAHCLEAYCAPGFHPMCEGIAVEGMRLVKDWLPVATQNGDDVYARGCMLAAASMGATAFQKGLGAIHALSHPVGAVYDTHHGLTNAVVMPYVLAFNRPVIEAKITRLAAWLGLPDPSFESFMAWVLALREVLAIDNDLASLGVETSRTEELAAMAAEDPTAGSNPTPLTPGNLAPLMQACIAGDLEAAGRIA